MHPLRTKLVAHIGVVIVLSASSVFAFSIQPDASLQVISASPLHPTRRNGCSTQVWAKRPGKKSKSLRVSSSSSSAAAAGGFAAAPEKSEVDLTGKLRSVSSRNAGAGSKALRQAALTFDRIRKETGVETCRDVYVRSPLNSETTFWFVGKVAFEAGSADGKAACLSQKRLIFEYSKQNLRPQNLGGKYASALELWLAPGDSEMDCVQNKVQLEKVQGSATDLADDFDVATVGYNPEIYVGDELTKGGLRVERDEQGAPTKPVFDVNQSA